MNGTVCAICDNTADWSCQRCEEPVCEDCTVIHTIHNCLEGTYCSNCYPDETTMGEIHERNKPKPMKTLTPEMITIGAELPVEVLIAWVGSGPNSWTGTEWIKSMNVFSETSNKRYIKEFILIGGCTSSMIVHNPGGGCLAVTVRLEGFMDFFNRYYNSDRELTELKVGVELDTNILNSWIYKCDSPSKYAKAEYFALTTPIRTVKQISGSIFFVSNHSGASASKAITLKGFVEFYNQKQFANKPMETLKEGTQIPIEVLNAWVAEGLNEQYVNTWRQANKGEALFLAAFGKTRKAANVGKIKSDAETFECIRDNGDSSGTLRLAGFVEFMNKFNNKKISPMDSKLKSVTIAGKTYAIGEEQLLDTNGNPTWQMFFDVLPGIGNNNIGWIGHYVYGHGVGFGSFPKYNSRAGLNKLLVFFEKCLALKSNPEFQNRLLPLSRDSSSGSVHEFITWVNDQLININNTPLKQKTDGKAIIVQPTHPVIRRGQKPTGHSALGKASRVAITVGYLRNRAVSS